MTTKETTIKLLIEKLEKLTNKKVLIQENSVREILPDMVALSNNSRITQSVAQAIVDKFDEQEFRDFMTWLRITKQNL